jgi:hypothetical protein
LPWFLFAVIGSRKPAPSPTTLAKLSKSESLNRLLQKIVALLRPHSDDYQPPPRQSEFQFRSRRSLRIRSIGSGASAHAHRQ